LDEGVSPAAIRHQLLSAQYRRELNFSRAGLEASQKAVTRLLDFRDRVARALDQAEGSGAGDPVPPLVAAARTARTAFEEAMDDDLNVSGGLGALFTFVSRGHSRLDEDAPLDPREGRAALELLDSLDEVLGVMELGGRTRSVHDDELEAWVEERIQARSQARQDRDWSRADAIREELADRGIVLEDGADGTRWKRAGAAVGDRG
jgi:cysteinyl-tRNA synthetase